MKKTNLLILLCLLTLNLFAWEGNGTLENPYKISSPQDLMELSNSPESFDGIYFRQTQDIDMQECQDFQAIGTKGEAFKGNYDGQNFKIKNLKVAKGSYGEERVAFFGHITTGAVIRNVHITENSSFEGTSYVGSIAAQCYFGGTIENCSSSATVVGAGNNVGGIVGDGYVVKNCRFTGSVTVDYQYAYNAGGIAGYINEVIENCYNYGTVKGNKKVGGVCGYITIGGNISDCYNAGNITGVDDHIGGVFGEVALGLISDVNIKKCYNSGNVKGNNYVGGIAGTSASVVSTTGNTGNVEATGSYAGGIAGSGTAIISYNKGNVTGKERVGGIVGALKEVASVNNCYNTGNVSGENYVGGLVGSANGSVASELLNSYSTGSIESEGGNVGGVVGYMNTGGLVNSNKIANTYWNSDIYAGTGVGNIVTPTETFSFYPKTTAELKNNFSITLDNGGKVWAEDEDNINNGYPILRHGLYPVSVEKEPSALSNIKVYSFGNQIYIANEKHETIKQVEIFDITGRALYSNSTVQNVISLDAPAGIYIVRLITGTEAKGYKVVLTK